MEKNGIVLLELSCRTAAELPPPDLTAPGGHPPEQLESFGGSSAPGVHRRAEYTAGRSTPPGGVHRRADGFNGGRTVVRQLRRGELGGSPAAQLPEYNPFLLHVPVLGLQRVEAKVPFPQFFSTMAYISPTTSLYLLWKCQRRQTVFMIHNIIRGAHSFWP